ncbi:MAG: NAD(P) transhydrogenase subunit alpha [Bifidobacteriaceae bacterium]|jgi:NAD(P) transhydrogenase subunit alpha|nr:NAD(P) transhydrogenase subunit alpha [Bifidobacteriaceae bacterium]
MTIITISITIFILAILIGYEVIGKVPSTLHTPLMSGANSIHGVVLVGVILSAGSIETPVNYILIFIAAWFGSMNIVGGYTVTDRMLDMFKKKNKGN